MQPQESKIRNYDHLIHHREKTKQSQQLCEVSLGRTGGAMETV